MNLIIIQSRNGSKRLPFKSVLTLSGYPTLLHIIKRVKLLEDSENKIIVATSQNNEDDIIADLCKTNKINCYRGHPTNVLSRFQHLAKKYNPENIIRVTGDCPLINPIIINQLISIIKKKEIDYASNTIQRTFPHGFDVEIFKSSIIKEFNNPSENDIEHVTPFIYNSKKYKLFSLIDKNNNSSFRLTLDTKYDYFFINKLIKKIFLRTNNYFQILTADEIKSIICADVELCEMHQIAKDKSDFSY